tara:strand:- start:18 stop:443 length:426 start_codon:yes stop_codon:yes gene_type:complete
MATIAYNGKCNPSGAQSQTLIDHTNSSGGVERVLISYIRTSPSTSVNGYMNVRWGNASDLIDVKVTESTAVGKNLAASAYNYSGDVYNPAQNYQGAGFAGGGTLSNCPTEVYIANGEKFELSCYGQNHILAYSILVIPESN